VDSLGTLVECAIPRVSPCSARVVRALIERRGTLCDANQFARSVGLRNRDQLRRVLRSDGLPCFEDLAGWIRVLGWVIEAETAGLALSRRALQEGRDPCSCFRTVKRLTGRVWSEVRVLGSTWVLLRFLDEIRLPKNSKSASSAPAGTFNAYTASDVLASA
jgi:hypothetical protein